MYYFTADEHYGHEKILEYCNRPFATIEEMDSELIRRHNSIVTDKNIVVHAGDFAFCKTREEAEEKYISKLNGEHIFLQGSHDYWLGGKKSPPTIWMQQIDKTLIVVCHYAMRTWPRSHYGSWHLFGHSHGQLEPEGLSMDIGVDCHDFNPVSVRRVQDIISKKINLRL